MAGGLGPLSSYGVRLRIIIIMAGGQSPLSSYGVRLYCAGGQSPLSYTHSQKF